MQGVSQDNQSEFNNTGLVTAVAKKKFKKKKKVLPKKE